jgi:hypothetical protein
MQPKFIDLRELAEHIDRLAAQVAGAVLRAIQLEQIPSSSVLTCERDLWRWAWRLRHLAANPHAQGTPDETPDVPRRVAVVLLVDLDKKRDLAWLGGQGRAAVGHTGDGWQIRHTSVHPDPILVATSVNPDLVRLLSDQPDAITTERGRAR